MTRVDSVRRPRSFTTTKVAEVTVLFWVVKVWTTGAGETTSDYFVRLGDPVIAVGVGFVAFAAVLAAQLAARRYIPWLYWGTVAMVSVFGTMVADVAHTGLGVPYWVSSGVFAVLLAVIFVVWKVTEGEVSIHGITTPRRERFYWATVLTTFALGTAMGDLLATSAHLGYFVSGLVFVAIIAVPAIGYRWWGWNAVGSFWFAYVTTRPLGASFADWMGVDSSRGGLGWGTGWVSVCLGVLIVVFVAVLDRRHRAAVSATSRGSAAVASAASASSAGRDF